MKSLHSVFLYIFLVLTLCSKLLAHPDSLIIGDGMRGAGSSPGTVKISLRNYSAVAGVQLSIRSEPNYLIASNVRLSERAEGIFNILEFFVTDDSTLRVLAMSADPTKVIVPGKGVIFEVDFEIDTGAPNATIRQSIADLKIVDKSGQYIAAFGKGGTFFDPQVTAFKEVAQFVGFDQLLEVSFPGAGGSAWADYDSDGDQDLLYFGDFTTLLRNRGDGTFEHVGQESGIIPLVTFIPELDVVSSAVWGDYDNDGDPDPFFIAWEGGRALLENNSDGTFTNVTASTMLPAEGEQARSANWVDFNNDGNLDIFTSDGSLFRNNGNKTFTDISSSVNLETFQYGGSAWADYDNDGDPDLMTHGRQYRNESGVFIDVTDSSGILPGSGFGGGLAWGDFDNDGFLDLYMTRSDFKPATLYKNDGDGAFTDVTESASVSVENARGAAWGDMDNDGDLDLFVTRPSVRDDPYRLFRNNGDGTFTNIHELTNVVIGRWVPGDDPGQSASWADFNNDGKLDLFVANETYPDFLFKNRGNGTSNHYLTIKLVGIESNRSAIGARVTVKAGDLIQIREVEGGANTSQNSLPLEFGIGQAQQVDKIIIRWPSGLEESTVRSVAVDQFLTIKEGTLKVVGIDGLKSALPKKFALFQNYPNPFNPFTTFQYQLPKTEHVTLIIYNIRGQKVQTLMDAAKQPGIYKIDWNSKNRFSLEVGTGLYVVRMEAGEFTESKKILLMK